MFRNYIKVTLRYLAKHKGYTAINVAGLGVGIACCILIMLFVRSEWSFDRFHATKDRLYRAWMEEHYQAEIFRNTTTPIPLVPVLQSSVPEIESACRVSSGNTAVKYNNVSFNDPVALVDSNFFSFFSFPLKEGPAKTPFANSSSVVITERTAKKYFGNGRAIGKALEIDLTKGKTLFTVTGVAKDPPLESSIQFDILLPMSNAPLVWSERAITNGWTNVAVESFFVLKSGTDVQKTNAKIASVLDPRVADIYKPGQYLVRLQPLTDIHFNSTLPDDIAKPSDPKYAAILASVGFLILLIACINFVTLSIGRSTTRALEVGVRKALGAERKELIKQFWSESILLTLFAIILGVGLALLLQKPFNQLANRELSLGANGFTFLFLFLLVVVIGLLAGIYPAFVLSAFKPIEVLKGKLKAGSNIGLFRKALIVGQFVASIVMIIGTFSIGKQLNFLRSKDLGYNREHVIVVSTNQSRKTGNQLAQRFKTELGKDPSVIGVTTSLYSMAHYGWMQLGYNDDKGVFRRFKFNAVDADFVPVMGLQMAAGRAFSKDNTADSNYILVNEALVKEYGWKDPIGQKLPGNYEERVLGVVKDFNIESLHSPIMPAVMALKPDSMFRHSNDVTYEASPEPRISVRFRGGNLQEHVALLQAAWKQVAADQDFDYVFLDDALNAAYAQEQRLGDIVRYASFLAIFIACMGLFGLATLVVVRRTKEIGIRKVLGADVSRIVLLLSKEFMLLVIIASLVAFPLAYWGLHKWLQDFAYRISVPWLVFIASALLALTIALLTVSFQAVKAAWMNPVKSLRTE